MRGLRTLLADASHYLGSVLIGVLLAPVLPDVVVDLFGGSGGRDAVLRLATLVVILAACLAAYRVQLRLARRRARRGAVLTNMGGCDVAVIPIWLRTTYCPRGERPRGEVSSLEYLVDTANPTTVVTVASPQVHAVAAEVGTQLARDGIVCETVELRDAYDPEIAVADAQRLILDLLADRGLAGSRIYVDTTGGTVPMSIAMLRVASLLGAECTYVESRRDRTDRLVPGSQRGRAFDPTTLFQPPSAT